MKCKLVILLRVGWQEENLDPTEARRIASNLKGDPLAVELEGDNKEASARVAERVGDNVEEVGMLQSSTSAVVVVVEDTKSEKLAELSEKNRIPGNCHQFCDRILGDGRLICHQVFLNCHRGV